MINTETSEVVGLFENRSDAEAAQRELIKAGFHPSEITLTDRAPAEATSGNEEGGFWESVKEFFGMEDATVYGEASRRGAIVLTVSARGDELVDRASDIIQEHDPINVNERASEYLRGAGDRGVYGGTEQAKARNRRGDSDESIPVTEERLRIGKRREERGGVRIYRRVSERPVEEDVTLRDEKVHVERREADRPADEEAFEEKTIEMRETHEEPVVTKEARVVEDVVVRKEDTEHTETVRDTVRRTDVDVEQLDEDYRRDFDSKYAKTGADYSQYRPAYQYGSRLAAEPQYNQRDWNGVEKEAQERFARENKGSNWDQMSPAVRYGYETARRPR